MAIYNTTFLDNATGFISVADGVNTMTNNLYAVTVLFCLFMILFISMKSKFDTEVTLLATSFIISCVAIFMFVMQWITLSVLTIPLIILLISVAYAGMNK